MSDEVCRVLVDGCDIEAIAVAFIRDQSTKQMQSIHIAASAIEKVRAWVGVMQVAIEYRASPPEIYACAILTASFGPKGRLSLRVVQPEALIARNAAAVWAVDSARRSSAATIAHQKGGQ